MHTLHKHTLAFAAALSALAGYVDAMGFLKLGGYFVSFMSGNSTQMAVGIVQHESVAAQLGAIIALFVAGAFSGSLLAHFATAGRRTVAVLAMVTALLALGAASYGFGFSLAAILLMTFAMGAANASLQGAGEQVVGVTYMTGTLVKVGQRLAHDLLNGGKYTWLPYLLLWVGLVSGGVCGAFLYGIIGLHSLWIAAGWAALLMLIAWRK